MPKICTIVIENLDNNMTEEELLDYFRTFDQIIDLSVPLNSGNNTENRRCCFIKYMDENVVDKVLQSRHFISDKLLCIYPYNAYIGTVLAENLDDNIKKEESLGHSIKFETE